MVSASKAARDAKKAEKVAAGTLKEPKSKLGSRAGSKNASGAATPLINEDGEPMSAAETKQALEIKRLAEQMDAHGLSDRVTTGVLSSLKASRDVKITAVSLVFHVSHSQMNSNLLASRTAWLRLLGLLTAIRLSNLG